MHHPSSTAALIGDTAISYYQLHTHITQTMHWLQPQLTISEQRIAVALREPYWHWVCTLALLQLGKSCATVHSAEELPAEVAGSFHMWLVDRTMPVPTRAITWNASALPSTPAQIPALASTGLQLTLPPTAQRFFLSSGTTGRPKMVALSAQDVLARLQATERQCSQDITRNTRLIAMMGLNTIGGFFLHLLTWVKGGSVILAEMLAEQGMQKLALAKCNLLSAAPGQIKEILQKTLGVIPGKEQRQVRAGGARLHPSLRDAALQRLGYEVQTSYGVTEVGVVASCNATCLDQHPGAAGWVLPHAQIEIVDAQHQPVPTGTQGLVRCKAPGMATAYEGAEHSPPFKEGWFYPGDVGTLSADGFLVITGRVGDVLNLGGYKLSAVDIEAQLINFTGIQDVCVVSIDYQDAYLLVVAAVCEDGLDVGHFKTHIKQVLKTSLPFYFVRVQSLHRNAMGKLPRPMLTQKLAAVVQAQQASATNTQA